MANLRNRIIGLTAIMVLSSQLPAQIHPDFPPDGTDPNRFPEPKPWQEPGFGAFKYPRDEDLIKVQVEPSSTLKMYLDRTSVVVNEGVTRLAYVLESKSGARNVLVEGFRCANFHYTTYATGGPDGKLYQNKSRAWVGVERVIRQNNFRLLWLTNYLCDFSRANLPRRDVLQMVLLPRDFPHPEEQ